MMNEQWHDYDSHDNEHDESEYHHHTGREERRTQGKRNGMSIPINMNKHAQQCHVILVHARVCVLF